MQKSRISFAPPAFEGMIKVQEAITIVNNVQERNMQIQPTRGQVAKNKQDDYWRCTSPDQALKVQMYDKRSYKLRYMSRG